MIAAWSVYHMPIISHFSSYFLSHYRNGLRASLHLHLWWQRAFSITSPLSLISLFISFLIIEMASEPRSIYTYDSSILCPSHAHNLSFPFSLQRWLQNLAPSTLTTVAYFGYGTLIIAQTSDLKETKPKISNFPNNSFQVTRFVKTIIPE